MQESMDMGTKTHPAVVSTVKQGQNPHRYCAFQAARDTEAVVRDTHASAMLFAAQHQSSLVTLGTFWFCLCVRQGQKGATSHTKPFAERLSQLGTAPQLSQGWTGAETALGSAHSLPLQQSPFPTELRAEHPPCPGWR